jgi:ribonuclease HI
MQTAVYKCVREYGTAKLREASASLFLANNNLTTNKHGVYYIMIEIYTDGGNSSKKKAGGCSAVICKGPEILKELSQGYDNNPTNNMMELGGVILGLTYMLEHPELGKEVTVISDSEYIVKGASTWLENWKKKDWKGMGGPVKNKPLWEAVDYLKSQLTITWKWVRGHDGNARNEIADKLAVKAYKDL